MKSLKLMGGQLTRHQMRSVIGGSIDTEDDGQGGGIGGGSGRGVCHCYATNRDYSVMSCLSSECTFWCGDSGWICSGGGN